MVLNRRIAVILHVYLMLIGLPLFDTDLTRILCLGVCINLPPLEVEALAFIPDSLG